MEPIVITTSEALKMLFVAASALIVIGVFCVWYINRMHDQNDLVTKKLHEALGTGAVVLLRNKWVIVRNHYDDGFGDHCYVAEEGHPTTYTWDEKSARKFGTDDAALAYAKDVCLFGRCFIVPEKER
jgi:hypothetical protein